MKLCSWKVLVGFGSAIFALGIPVATQAGAQDSASIRRKPFLKRILETPVLHVVEKSKNGDTWDIWRKRSGEWATSKGDYRMIDYRTVLENGKWRKVAAGENTATCAINTYLDWIRRGLHYDRGGSDITQGQFLWNKLWVPKTSIFWVYGEPMQGSTEIICDGRTGEPRIVVEDYWGLPVSEATTNDKRTVVYICKIDLNSAWPEWAQ
ncbi:MAG: hypothetical protein K8R88_11170 [Armatimonadetes bacterium]|nr:hypothetical protein [Armatimonadota bacterium]